MRARTSVLPISVDDWKQGLDRQIFASREIEEKVSEPSTGSLADN